MSFLLLALAVVALPGSSSRRRLRALLGRGRVWRRPPRTLTVAVGLGALVGLLGGVGGVIAGGLLGATLFKAWQLRGRQRERLRATGALADGLGGFVAELRAGAHPAKAAMGAAEDAESPADDVLRVIAAVSARGGDVEAALAGTEGRALARAWRLSGEHGVPLADVMDEVRRDLKRRVAFAGQVQARMAGPRASAAVLAVLPAVGVVLGELTGAGPLAVLVGTGVGQALLVIGVALVCVGLRWSDRLTRQVVT
jgi:tight adherence protein B